jgi:hypothetical protein
MITISAPKMSHPIWKIGLFTKLSKDNAECNDCKKNGITKHVFLLSGGSIKSLITHMNSKLHVEVPVRWNFSLHMAQRLCEQKDAVDRYAFENKDLNLTLSEDDWSILEELVKVLISVEDVSLLFCKDKMSSFLPYATQLSRVLKTTKIVDKEVETIKNKIIDGISSRFLSFEWERSISILD